MKFVKIYSKESEPCYAWMDLDRLNGCNILQLGDISYKLILHTKRWWNINPFRKFVDASLFEFGYIPKRIIR